VGDTNASPRLSPLATASAAQGYDGSFLAREAIRDTVTAASAAELEDYLNSD